MNGVPLVDGGLSLDGSIGIGSTIMDWNPTELQFDQILDGEDPIGNVVQKENNVTIGTSDGRTVCIAREHLEECSLFFRTLLNGTYADSNADIINLSNITAEALQACIALSEKLSSGDSVIDELSLRSACHALDTASYLSMDELIEKLSETIIRNLDSQKILEVYRFVERRNVGLAKRIWKIMMREFDKIVISGSFTGLSRDEMEVAMQEEWLNITTAQEAQVVDGWAKSQPNTESRSFRDFALDNMNTRAEDQSAHFVFKKRIPNSVILALGGWSAQGPTNLIETFNSRTNSWISSPPNLQERLRSYHGMEVMGARRDKLFVIGGFNGTDYFPHTKMFDFDTLQWEQRSAMHNHRCYVSAVGVDDNHLIAMGGFNGSERMRSAEMYDIINNQWYRISDMNNARSDASSFRLGDRVYSVGGFDGNEIHRTMEGYDTHENRWIKHSRSMNIGRTGVSAVALTEHVAFVVGGFNGTTRLRSCEFCDIREGLWHKTSEMLTTRSNFGCSVFHKDVIAAGGFDGTRTCAKSERFDVRANKWIEMPTMVMAKSALKMVTVENHEIIRSLINYH